MDRNKAKDHEFFSCQAESEIDYIVNLYSEKKSVKEFTLDMCKDGVIKYITYHTLYKLIEKDLGFPVPN
jgi:hypothetical protein